MSQRVVSLRKAVVEVTPPPPTYALVPNEARAAADALVRRATGIQRALGATFATTASLSALPDLIEAAGLALAELKELTQ